MEKLSIVEKSEKNSCFFTLNDLTDFYWLFFFFLKKDYIRIEIIFISKLCSVCPKIATYISRSHPVDAPLWASSQKAYRVIWKLASINLSVIYKITTIPSDNLGWWIIRKASNRTGEPFGAEPARVSAFISLYILLNVDTLAGIAMPARASTFRSLETVSTMIH